MNSRAAIAALLAVLVATKAFATTTNKFPKGAASGQVLYDVPKGVELGRELITQLQRANPEASFTNSGTLFIKAKRQPSVKVAYTCRVIVTSTNWTSYYSAVRGTNAFPGFSVEHRPSEPNIFRDDAGNVISDSQLDVAFAGSDFWRSDLGLEYFHWPEQRVLKWEMKSHVGCQVLESRNPTPRPTGYARVLSWIHDESRGIVRAEAYDTQGILLKEFRPTELEKVNGRQELKEMVIENVKTESVTRLVFDL